MRARLAFFLSASLLGGCATSIKIDTKTPTVKTDAKLVSALPLLPNKNPFPSTYKPLPSKPTLIKSAHIYDGSGGELARGDVLMVDGKVSAISAAISDIPAGTETIDGSGLYVTPGIVDIHSHMGVYAAPSVEAHSDGNESTNPTTGEVWAEHSVWPQDPQFGRALASGITSMQILPGSANLIGGRSVTLKNVPSRTMQGMKFPDAPYGLKMACGENPKRVYGGKGRSPASRMANVAGYRAAWIKAADYKKRWDAFAEKVAAGTASAKDAPGRDLESETLAGVLSGEILVHNHCYRADEMVVMIDIAKEFGYKISTFHHAVESYKIADILKRENICSAMWADWWGFKLESYDAIRENIPFVHNAGACAIVHSDSPVGIQRLNQEAAKALADGNRLGLNISKATAWSWLALNPAKAMGIADKTGSLEKGKMADIILWNADPFTVASRPLKVWIDGALMFDRNDPKRQPVWDFEVGQPGSGDVK
jgi:imidazolonepropionase-like amidohydrolase